MSQRDRDSLTLLLIGVALVLFWGGGGSPIDIIKPTPKVDAVTCVYDRMKFSVPPAVLGAFDKLNRQGIRAGLFEVTTRDGEGQVPDQHKVADAAAKDHGVPAIVVEGGGEVVKVFTATKETTEQEVLEAAR